MCYYKPITVISILIFFSFYSCVGEADLTGFIRSTDRNEERLRLSLHSNSNNGFRRIVSLSDEYCILVASDAHLGEAKNLTHFLQQGEQQGIEALVLVGDIVSGKEKDYLLLTDVISSHSTKPLFLLTGNHELYFDGWKHFFRLFGSSVYYFSVASNNSEDLFICLDSGSGSIGKSQLQWLNNLLSDKRDKYRNCIIFTHNNFFRNRFTASTNPPENEIIVLMDLFLKYDVNMVIMGHDHKRAQNQFGNIKYITLDALADYNKNPSYLKLKFSRSDLTHVFIEIK